MIDLFNTLVTAFGFLAPYGQLIVALIGATADLYVGWTLAGLAILFAVFSVGSSIAHLVFISKEKELPFVAAIVLSILLVVFLANAAWAASGSAVIGGVVALFTAPIAAVARRSATHRN